MRSTNRSTGLDTFAATHSSPLGHSLLAPPEQIPQEQRVSNGCAAVIVVEEGPNLSRGKGRDPFGPSPQLAPPVVRPDTRALVEPDVRPATGNNERSSESRPVGEDQRVSPIVEHAEHLVLQPRRIAELERGPHIPRQPRDEVTKPRDVGRKPRRQLEQNRSELRVEARRTHPEELHPVLGVPEPLQVREV